MRRRRQKNPLLGRIIGISILAHVIFVPVLAHFGAFKKIQEHFVQTQMVVMAPPEAPREKPAEKKEPAKKTAVAKAKSPTSHSQSHSTHTNQNQVHIAMAAGKEGDPNGDGAEQGTKNAGELPTENTNKTADKVPDGPKIVVPDPKPIEKPVEKVVEKPVEKVVEKPVEKVVEKPVEPVVPKAPVFTAAQPVDENEPKPSIPDDLRTDALDKTFVAECTVGEDGTAMDVKAVQSTGNDELDRRAMDAAKKWRFKPATRDGQPVVGKVRIFIEFQVN